MQGLVLEGGGQRQMTCRLRSWEACSLGGGQVAHKVNIDGVVSQVTLDIAQGAVGLRGGATNCSPGQRKSSRRAHPLS